jgi:hypothetical protein
MTLNKPDRLIRNSLIRIQLIGLERLRRESLVTAIIRGFEQQESQIKRPTTCSDATALIFLRISNLLNPLAKII